MQRLEQLAGDSFRIDQLNNGWPALCQVRAGRQWIWSAIHMGLVIESHRQRPEERRIENPGKERPVQRPPGTVPLILGLWEVKDACAVVAFDAFRRIDEQTRKSMFMKLDRLRFAAKQGWAQDESSSGEQIFFFAPSRIGEYVEQLVAARAQAA
nr:hypothetical protein [Kofleriaceae bacterium]